MQIEIGEIKISFPEDDVERLYYQLARHLSLRANAESALDRILDAVKSQEDFFGWLEKLGTNGRFAVREKMIAQIQERFKYSPEHLQKRKKDFLSR